MIDELQHLRMFYVWPWVVGATAFYASRLILVYVNADAGLRRHDIALAVLIGGMAAVVARRISETWANDGGHWLAFTMGLAFLAVVLIGTGLITAFDDIDRSDRRRGL